MMKGIIKIWNTSRVTNTCVVIMGVCYINSTQILGEEMKDMVTIIF